MLRIKKIKIKNIEEDIYSFYIYEVNNKYIVRFCCSYEIEYRDKNNISRKYRDFVILQEEVFFDIREAEKYIEENSEEMIKVYCEV